MAKISVLMTLVAARMTVLFSLLRENDQEVRGSPFMPARPILLAIHHGSKGTFCCSLDFSASWFLMTGKNGACCPCSQRKIACDFSSIRANQQVIGTPSPALLTSKYSTRLGFSLAAGDDSDIEPQTPKKTRVTRSAKNLRRRHQELSP